MQIKIILIISLTIVFLEFIDVGKKNILKIYFGSMFFSTILVGIYNFDIIKQSMLIPNLGICIIMIFIAVGIYSTDFLIFNMIKHDMLILDIKYYFKGNINKSKFAISCIFTVMEEIVFRVPLVHLENYSIIYILVSSISFGIIHIYFSKYDCFSKFIFGVILGSICLISHSLICCIIVHVTYNYLVLKVKE